VFDSTGTGLQDVVAAIATYQAAIRESVGERFRFSRDPRIKQRPAVEFNA